MSTALWLLSPLPRYRLQEQNPAVQRGEANIRHSLNDFPIDSLVHILLERQRWRPAISLLWIRSPPMYPPVPPIICALPPRLAGIAAREINIKGLTCQSPENRPSLHALFDVCLIGAQHTPYPIPTFIIQRTIRQIVLSNVVPHVSAFPSHKRIDKPLSACLARLVRATLGPLPTLLTANTSQYHPALTAYFLEYTTAPPRYLVGKPRYSTSFQNGLSGTCHSMSGWDSLINLVTSGGSIVVML